MNYLDFKLSCPWTSKDSNAEGEQLRVRVRTKWKGQKLEIPGFAVNSVNPPTQEQALRLCAEKAWLMSEKLRNDCGAPPHATLVPSHTTAY